MAETPENKHCLWCDLIYEGPDKGKMATLPGEEPEKEGKERIAGTTGTPCPDCKAKENRYTRRYGRWRAYNIMSRDTQARHARLRRERERWGEH